MLQGHKLNGIVTRSDLLKLPVRLLAFARVTHLELILANLISAHYPDDSWLPHLSKKQQKEIEHLHKHLSNDRIDPTRLEISGFEPNIRQFDVLLRLGDSELADVKVLAKTVEKVGEKDIDVLVLRDGQFFKSCVN